MLVKFHSRDFLDSTIRYINLVAYGYFYEFMVDELQKLTGKTWSREEAKGKYLKCFSIHLDIKIN